MASESNFAGASVASARMIEHAQESVVRVRSGGRGVGAGVVWDEHGLVLTNRHVVTGRRRGVKVQVIPCDGRTLDAEVVGRDRSLDLALLRVPVSPGNLPAVPVGDSNALRTGELVFAIGHPWGRLRAVTAGIVSGLSGAGRGPGGRARYVRSDVSLAPGNSGGPLLNARGEVVAASPMIRAGLRSMLAAVEGTEVWVVGEAGSPTDSDLAPSEADVVLVAEEELLEEVVLVDDGIQAILVLSEDEGVVPKLRALPGDPRGWGVVPPDASPEELGAAVAAVGQGLVVFPRPLGERLLREPATAEELPEPPTARELEVLELLGRGLSNKLIARELHISEHTVKFHVSSLYAKLGVNNRAEAVGRGARYGLVSL